MLKWAGIVFCTGLLTLVYVLIKDIDGCTSKADKDTSSAISLIKKYFVLAFMETQSKKASLTVSPVDYDTQLDILSYHQRELFDIINFVFIGCIIGMFGIGANIINIVVFYRQGFANTVNISFFGLAISDLCCLVAMEWVCICLNPLVAKSEAPWVAEEFQYLTGAWPHVTCARITSFITVYVTAERCLCILMPLKVKAIITPARTAIVICVIYIMNILTLVPEYYSSFLDWRFFPNRNRTLLTVLYISNRKSFEGLVYFLCSVTGMLSFISVIIFTLILIIKLRQSSQWRTQATSGPVGQRGILAGRDKKTVKMVVIIAGVLIVCYVPGTIISMAAFVEPELNIQKRYMNTCISMWSIGFVFQTANSSVNIIMYYTMSSNYRQTFQELFSACRTYNVMQGPLAKRSD